MVCSSAALDQFLAREPEYLLSANAEEARIDPGNVEILVQHLKCAAFEAPFAIRAPGATAAPAPATGERYSTLTVDATRDALEYLVTHGIIHASGGRYHYIGDPYPASNVSLRSVGWDNFVIVDLDTNKSLAELDFRSAHTMLHEQAIYQHDAEQYQVERLDYDDHKAFVRKVAPDYFTTALTYRTVQVLDVTATGAIAAAPIGWGEVKVVERVTGYKKVKFFTHENAGYGDVNLPELQMHTTGFWLTLSEARIDELGAPRAELVEALRGAGVALEAVATLALMCEPSDIGRTLGDGSGNSEASIPLPGRDPHAGRTGGVDPTVFLFDAIPGGVGLAQRIFERAAALVDSARELIAGCPCDRGCPACIGPGEARGRKELSLAVLAELAGSTRKPRADREGRERAAPRLRVLDGGAGKL
jgi:DEAD/DEAH box helicase domain-containing protein